MSNLYGILKSSNCLSMLNGDNFGACHGIKPSKESNIFTAKNFLEYCRLFIGPTKPAKAVGLSLVHVIANEPRFKDGIIRRCELPLRIKSKGFKPKPHVQPISQQKEDKVPVTSDSTSDFINQNVVEINVKPFLNLNLENKPNEEIEPKLVATMKTIQKYESVDSLTPMLVNDIKSFALLDAKFREDRERNFLNESIVMLTEEFIREIKPTYSDPKTELINELECDKEDNVNESETEKSENLNQESITEVIMCPRPTSPKKSASVTDQEKDVDKRPVLYKLKFVGEGKDVFKKTREKGWRIRQSYDMYKAKQANRSTSRLSRPSQCTSEVAASKSVASHHPTVKAVISSWQMPDVRNAAAEKIRRSKEAEKRIRASFKAFVERQNQGRTLRALREQ